MAFFKHPLLKENTVEYREYQDIIARRVVERGNSLVVLPTGLGKTIIAILVAIHQLEKNPGKKVLFLAPTKPLVSQHYESFAKLTKLNSLGLLTGETKEAERRKIVEESQVIFATPQTIENMLFRGDMNLKDFALIIFDEAHRAVGEYAYVFIADRYAKENPEGLILAITASPGGTREKIQEIMKNLFIKNVEVKTEKDEDVKKYVPGKRERWVYVEFPEEFQEIRALGNDSIKEILEKLKEMGVVNTSSPSRVSKKQLLELQETLAREAKSNPSAYGIIPYVSALVKINHLMELLETQGLTAFWKYLEKLKKDKSKGAKLLASNPRFAKMEHIARKLLEKGVEHPKLEKLVEILGKKSVPTIVFTQYRSSAKLIEDRLNRDGIPCRRFVGQATREGDKGLKQKEQAELLEKFRNGKFRVLIATSVGEEGIDIPSVDLVVFYEPIPSEVRKIQRAGRTGRKAPGEVVYLITKGTRDEAFYWASKHKEREMRRTLEELASTDTQLQKTLAEFISLETPKNPTIFVDTRELKSGIVEKLKNLGVTVKEIKLEVGDYLISERVVVERKTAKDFVNSIIDGRLFDQARALVENFQRPILLIEGNNFFERNIHPNAIRGAIASLVMDFGIPIVHTKDLDETAELLATMAKRELKNGKLARLREEKKPTTDKELQLYLVEGLPGVGPELARKLLRKFKTVEGVFTANEKELKTVEGLGPKRAKEIRRILTKEWTEEKD